MIGARPPGSAAPSLRAFRHEYLGRVLDGDLPGAEAVVARARLAGVASPCLIKQIIAPALSDIGGMWMCGELSVADEHMATEISTAVVNRLLARPPDGDRLAVVACAPSESHSLGARAFSVLLGERGWRVAYLGPRTPSEDLDALVAARVPDLVAFSVKLPAGLRELEPAIRRIKDRPLAPCVLVGGAGAVAAPCTAGLAADRVEDDVDAALNWLSRVFGS